FLPLLPQTPRAPLFPYTTLFRSRAKSASQDNRSLNVFDDASADVLIMAHTKRANLRVTCAMAVKQQEIDDSIIALGDRDALRSRHRHASHQQNVWKRFSQVDDVLGP